MRKFFINITLFLLPLIGGYLLLEKRLEQIPNSYSQKKIYIEKQLADVEVVNVGASHALNGINPEYFSHKGFNLANVTQTIYYDRALMETYIDRMPKLKMVFIPISYFTLYRRLQDLEEDWRMYFYYFYWKIDVPGKSVFDINKYSLFTIYSPHRVMGMMRRNFKVDLAPKYSIYGYEGKDTTGHVAGINDESGKSRVQYHNIGYTPDHVNNGKQDLEKLVQMLRARNIEVVLVSMPVYHTYYNNNNPEILAMNKQVAESMCARYNCHYYNYYTDPRFTLDDFGDNDHLSFIGATKFSKILDSEIIKPILK